MNDKNLCLGDNFDPGSNPGHGTYWRVSRNLRLMKNCSSFLCRYICHYFAKRKWLEYIIKGRPMSLPPQARESPVALILTKLIMQTLVVAVAQSVSAFGC
jgi:hypothetical protein